MTRKRLIIIAVIVIGIPAVALAWWLLSPLIIDKRVSEDFPFAANAVIPSDMTIADAERVMTKASQTEQSISENMPDSLAATGSTGGTNEAIERLKSGSFRDADGAHEGSGTATIYQNAAGALILRLEDFEVTNGPELHVILSTHADPQGRNDVHQEGYLDIGKLKGNIGNQNYVIPVGADVSAIKTVVIYCQSFHVVFSVAALQSLMPSPAIDRISG